MRAPNPKAAAVGRPFAVVVELVIAAEAVASFMPLICANALASLDEPGCRRFDVCVDAAAPEAILLYEIYDDASAFAEHCETPHFKAFDRESAAMILSKTVRRFEVVG